MKAYLITCITCFSTMTYPMFHLQKECLTLQKRTFSTYNHLVDTPKALNRIKKSKQWKDYQNTIGNIVLDQHLMIKVVSSQRKKHDCRCPLQKHKEWPGNWCPMDRYYLNPALCTCLQKLNFTRQGHDEKIDLLKEQQKDLETLLVNELNTTPDNKLNYLDYIFTCLKDPEYVKHKLRLTEKVKQDEDPYEGTNGE